MMACVPNRNLAAIAAFPTELKQLPRWVTWKYEMRDGKRTKVPYNPSTHRRAKSTDPSTWGDFETAIRASSTRLYAGIGCMIAAPYAAVDLDKCRDAETGVVEPWASEIIAKLNSYTELSPSGRGVHVWIVGTVPSGGNKRDRIEMYDFGRYFTVTGDHVAGTPLTIEERDLAALHSRTFARPVNSV
jgi:primase-polymerase (primpol)-like protein